MAASMRVVKWLGVAFVGLLGLVALIYLILFAINFQDQPPSESSDQLDAVSASIPSVPDDQNGYVYLLGFAAKPGEQPVNLGKERIAWAQQVATYPPPDEYLDFPGNDYAFREYNAETINQLLVDCKVVTRQCATAITQRREALTDWVASQDLWLARYQTLVQYPGWFESIPFDPFLPLPRYSDVLDAQLLLHTHLWLNAKNADSAEVKAVLERDLHFWRTVLASSDILITSMIAVAAIRNHFSWGSFILQQLPEDRISAAIPSDWQRPFSAQEQSPLRWMIGEWKASARLLRRAKDYGSYPFGIGNPSSLGERFVWLFAAPLLQPQDSINRYADLLLGVDATLSVPYTKYPEAVEHAKAQWNQSVSVPIPTPYNPIGRLLLADIDVSMINYHARILDLEGVRQLTLAITDLHRQSVTHLQAGRMLYESRYRNPYTNEAFEWDEESGTAIFRGLATGDRSLFTLVF